MTEPIESRATVRRVHDCADLPTALREAIRDSMYEVLRDPEITRTFWKRGYEEFTGHAGNSASQWVGKRILTAIVTAVFVFAVGYLAKNGALK